MAWFKVTDRDGGSQTFEFNGTIQQFVMKKWRYGVPDGKRVDETSEAPVAGDKVASEAVEPEVKHQTKVRAKKEK